MKTSSTLLRAVVLTAMLLGLAPGVQGQVSSWKQIVIKPLPEFHPQQPKRIELPNGMVIFLQEDHELPVIRGTARIRGGSREEPADKIGLVDIYGDVWRTGGTKSQTGDQLDDFLEARGARVETGGGSDSTFISWDCLKESLDDVFPIFNQLLRDPEFRADKLPVAKSQINTSISRRNDNADGIVAREARLIGYGADSPYAREPQYATVAAVTRQDLVDWHHQYVQPNNIILGVTGDFDSTAMEARLRAALESWPKGPAAETAKVTFKDPKPGVYFVDKDDVNQSNIRMVELGIRRDNPDYYAIRVVNEIFGGGFSSRLIQDIRTAKGLAYSVGGGIGSAFDHPGLFQVGMGTKSGTTAAAIDALFQEIDDLKAKPPTAVEVKRAKDAILNSFVFDFDSKDKVLAERMAYEFYGYPADYLERFQAGVERVTPADAARVAAQYVHRDKLAVIVVGKSSDFDKPLSTFGPVTNLDITIPQPGGEAAETSTSSNPEGKALLAKIIQQMGGGANVSKVKSIQAKATLSFNTPQGTQSMDAEEISVYPDQSWQKMTTPRGDMIEVVSPQAAFMAMGPQSWDMPSSQKKDVVENLRRDPIDVAQHADDPHYVFSADGTEKVGEVDAEVLSINAGGTQVRWYVDPASGKVIRASWQEAGPEGPGETIADYSDWKTVDGITLPFQEERSRNGDKMMSVEIKAMEVNPTIDPKIFEKPAAPSGAGQN
jgi:zinc protease